MKSLFISPKGVAFEKEVSDQEFEDLKSKGYKPAVDLVSPKGSQYTLAEDDPRLGEALKSGHKTKAQVDASNEKIETSAPEAFARGLANAGTFGFSDEISGGFGALKDAFRKGTLKDLASDYANERDRFREADDAAYKDNGVAYGSGYGLGALGTAALIPGAATIKGAAGIGAGLGALGAAGSGTDAQGQADLTKGELGQFAKNVGMGSAVGGTLGGVSQALIKPEAAKDLSEYFAYRSTGGLKQDINKLYATTPKEVGQTLLDEGVIPTFGKRGGEELKQNVQKAVDKYSGRNEQLLKELDQTGGFDVQNFVSKVRQEIDAARKSPSLDAKKYGDNLEERLGQYLEAKGASGPKGDAGLVDLLIDEKPVTQSFSDTVADRRLLQDAAKFRPSVDNTSNEAAKKMSQLLNQSIDEQAANRLGQETASTYTQNRFQQKKLLDATKAIEQSQQREQANKLFGITDYSVLGGGGAAALGTANPGIGLATLGAVGAKKLAENYGDAFAANVLNQANKIIQKYGVGEGSRRLANVFGAKVADQIVQQLQGQKK